MRTRRHAIKVGARLAVGVLAAVYLWNLKIVSTRAFREGSWNSMFPTVATTSPLYEEEPSDEIIPYPVEDTHPQMLSTPDAINITLPPPERRVPNFIILGAQKAGTQALRTYLSQHPLVYINRKIVEPHFFDWGFKSTKSYEQNLQDYIKLINGKKTHDCRLQNCIAGESTPSYLFTTNKSPARIKKVCPWTKFIVILRDPVKRAHSACNMLIQKHEVKTTFRKHFKFDLKWMKNVGLLSDKNMTKEEEDEAWNRYFKHRRVKKMILGRGLYELQLRKWFEYFPREQFLILKSEDLDRNRTATMSRVFQFLGLQNTPLEKDEKVHSRKYTATMSDKTKKELYDFYRPYNKRLETLLGPEWKDVWEENS